MPLKTQLIDLLLVRSMVKSRANVSDTCTFCAAGLLIFVRIGLALVFADALALLVFRASYQPLRLAIGCLLLLCALFVGGFLLRDFQSLPSVIWNSFCLGAVLFLGIVWRYHNLHIASRSLSLEYFVSGVCLCMFAIAVLTQRSRKRKT